MAPSKKKKKAAGNPARGFTTVSVPSKPKRPTPTESEEPVNENYEVPALITETPISGGTLNTSISSQQRDTRELHELPPEELERHLEEAELQAFVDKYSIKCKSDAARYTTRLVSEKRVLRSQAIPFSASAGWLSPDLLERLVEKENAEAIKLPNEINRLDDEEACASLWTLRLTLLGLGFQKANVDEALKIVLRRSHPEQICGKNLCPIIEQSLYYLVLHENENELFLYNESKPLSTVGVSTKLGNVYEGPWAREADSKRDLNLNERTVVGPEWRLGHDAANESTLDAPERVSRPSTPESDSSAGFSDPELLVPEYLTLKSHLYSLDPSIFNDFKSNQIMLNGTSKDTRLGSNILRLKRKLARIEKDVLFDHQEANQRWNEKLSQLRRATGESMQKERNEFKSGDRDRTQSESTRDSEEPPIGLFETDKNEAYFGDIFASEPNLSGVERHSSLENKNTVIKLRAFGKKPAGVDPRKMLEDACRARDPNYKLSYYSLSPASYSCRKAVEISWSKSQGIAFDVPLADISYNIAPNVITVSMYSVSAETALEAESYLSTIALFILSCHAWKENRISMKLTGAWKDVWDEVAQEKKEYDDRSDREAVREIKNYLEQHNNQFEEDIVLTKNFRQGNRAGERPPSKTVLSQNHDQAPLGTNLQALWTNRSSTPSFQRMLESRKNLPIWSFRQQVIDTLAESQVIIVCGETGSGKSTQVPSFILENELVSGRSSKIFVTEPRRISAISLARRVSEELGENKNDIGTNRSLVGYTIRLESKVTTSTRLIFATTGVVIRMLERPQNFNDVTHLVLDEVHERTIDGDFLLIVLRRLLQTRTDLKLVLMSATVDAGKFSEYLNNAPILNVPGRMYPVESKYLEDVIELTHHQPNGDESHTDDTDASSNEQPLKPTNDTMRSTLINYSKKTQNTVISFNEYRLDYRLIVNMLMAIASRPEFRVYSKAILIFMPGLAEIRRLQDEILSESIFQSGWVIHSLHSSVASEDQEKAFLIPLGGLRKIVLATNIAETGITIPDITAVIDTGKEKIMRFDERRQISKLVEVFVSRANAKQRRGRAGRVQKGICFHLFSKYRHDKLFSDQQVPEMLRLSLQDLILRVKISSLGDVESIISEALDPPSPKNVRRAIESLKAVKALTGAEALTPLGKQLAKLPLDVFLGKLIIYGAFFKCVDAAVSIAAIVSCKSPFLSHSGRRSQIEASRKAFERGNSDLLTVYNAYTSWKKHRADNNQFTFCRKNSLSPQALLNIEDVKTQLLTSLVDTGLLGLNEAEKSALNRAKYTGRKKQFFVVPQRMDFNSSNDTIVNSVIAWSFYPRILNRHGKGWRNIYNNQSVVLHSTSVNRHSVSPLKWLSYYHIMQSQSRSYNAHETSAVEDIAIVLCCGDVEFKMFAGVITIDGNRIKFKVHDWKSMIVLKTLSDKIRNVIAQTFKDPKKELLPDQKEWIDLFLQVFTGKETIGKETVPELGMHRNG